MSRQARHEYLGRRELTPREAALQDGAHQPVRARGEEKRLLELSVAEAGPALLDAGLITAGQLGHTLAAMRLLGADDTVLAVMPRMSQVWARKPALPAARAG